jgi:hypothetical protein
MPHLTNAQLLTLKASILAETDPIFVGYRTANDKPSMAAWYNANTAPAFIVWKTSVPVSQVGQAFSSSEVAGLTTANTNRLQVMASYSGGSFNPSIADVRAGFDSVFSGAGGANTRAALLALWKRTARRFEKLYATGTGSDAVPALLVVEGTLDGDHIGEALEAQ